jgi:carbonic anhydrase
LLIEGNRRFLRGEARFAGIRADTLSTLAEGQRPHATILGCSDSRVPPELLFDAGLGELFVIRVAGNILSPEVGGSLQYAGSHLETPLFVVLGHEDCGAVQAALACRDRGVRQRSHIQILVDNILAGLPEADPDLAPEVQVSRAVEANVRWTMQKILDHPEARDRLAEGRARLVGAVYDLRSGRVRFL